MASNHTDHASNSPELPPGYQAIPEEEQKKAVRFFDYGKNSADTSNFEYAIELYIQGLGVDPENVNAHQALREISLKRKASGGKSMGMMQKMKLKAAKDDNKALMLNAEKLLAYDPGNMDHMLAMFQNAFKAGYYDTAIWIGGVLLKANSENPKPEYNKFIALKEGYSSFEQWHLAVEACGLAQRMRPEDMDLQKELKDLSARDTMAKGKYGVAKSFRDSIRDTDSQQRLIDEDRDVQTNEFLIRKAREAEVEWQNTPGDLILFSKYIDALRGTESSDYENKAIEELDKMHKQTGQFKWRQKIGEIKMVQLSRVERVMRADKERDPALKQEYMAFLREKIMLEMQEFQLIVENYPTDTTARFQMASRMFQLGQFQEVIPVFQQVRNDPKFRVQGSVLLGRAFLDAGYGEEAVETLRAVLDEYPAKGDERSRELYYWYGRGLENHGDIPGAIKMYSQVAQLDFNYRDVQERIKRLRGPGNPK
ncbi:MAG TPA: hypothetical protein VH370_09990 [Humisphaera sp.]|jgi:tetratricopeptide (TPR) repeat protein|nr:hypothetical protein [Humisphaera sp.]